ncbi:SDR family NAD(P)-dependent oxidoreductase [Paractinoplanes atraurantiacus]|uniref:NADP-dependent 3-hydroxy acid dehydrogenase YdfG n=1 Tax=Paractinoplanes atraurantiacus TaxID=1036182 RepID=A0A285KLB3_9ACTN|nr:SDR family NAD(P)-dependent oxidoreductase [Actinoplanes atraurantiacus]SNY72071.1 NADP-dependent 3-hydroxy acid dehydrogenase YdfG [Actinoplanes atraurantiacus]
MRYLITGASSGLGLAVTHALTAGGHHVILAVRDERKARDATAGLSGVDIRHVDLADLESVRDFALPDEVDVLINNAGVMAPARTGSAQGHELQFAVNHLAHFALTGLLLGRLTTRVVTVTSVLAKKGRLNFDDLRAGSPSALYNQSKLANAVFGLELHRRLTDAGSRVQSVLAHPGYAVTGLQAGMRPSLSRLFLTKIGNPLLAVPADRGARPILHAATEPSVTGGQLIGPGGPGEMRGAPKVLTPPAAATDPETGQRLWELSEKLTGVHYPGERENHESAAHLVRHHERQHP